MQTTNFDLFLPEAPVSGAIFASPHSGRRYGEAFLDASVLDSHTLRSSEDAFVDKLIAAAPRLGVPLLVAHTPRAFVDLNRAADELDPALILGVRRQAHNPRVTSGLGVIPRVVAGGRPIYHGRIPMEEAQRRLGEHWHPYHQALQDLLAAQRAAFGRAILVDCHSMPHEAIEHHCTTMDRLPDVVLGDRFGASADPDVTAAIEAVFESEGLVVARNSPFAGAYISQRYGRPSSSQSVVQVELDRSLYMDERTLVPHEGFARITRVMTRLIETVSGIARPQMPLAAE
ncbi:N-formylglutamate amidohydrolase [Mangrovicoccus algicola]|uniref:N-formylglutamate amidohydrolase n=1 Tax=Mangrovicoccus algicola TaxID=2771008 RepID=A0A8J7D064_9RHOB|nr:N-formylglutamate amidohydrolase [Mangrovicoccus algicola]MBE3639013.1 N-formylglutamate amidohydrolase [Mangrovicoccus algicola]